MKFINEEKFTFDDVLLVPRRSSIKSRKDVDTSVHHNVLGAFSHPFIPANMDTVSGETMVVEVVKNGGLGMLHRFMTVKESEKHVRKFLEIGLLNTKFAISVGISEEEFERLKACYEAGAKVFCVDVAHGHSDYVIDFIKKSKDMFPDIVIIAGNVVTPEGVYDLATAGASLAKVSIGCGSICATRGKTGIGYPQLSAIIECSNGSIPIIADGGMRSASDVVKALAAGADFVMSGRMFAGCDETPGSVISKDGQLVKEYRGMASKEANESFFGYMPEWKTAEGISSYVPIKGSMKRVLNDYLGGLRSGMTYCDARTLKELKEKATFVKVSNNTVLENHTHILENK